MARTLTPERRELLEEALELRRAGLTQPVIAEILDVPFPTIRKWVRKMGGAMTGKMGNAKHNDHNGKVATVHNGITLYQGKYEDIGHKIPKGSIDLIITDPPYVVADNNITRTGRADFKRDHGEWDKTPDGQYANHIDIWADLMCAHLKNGGSLYLFMDTRKHHLWTKAFESRSLIHRNTLIWHRSNPAPQIRQTQWCHSYDAILYFTKGVAKTFKWQGQNEMHDVLVGGIASGNERLWHPTQKPRWLLLRLIKVSSMPRDTVLDPFAGSGSTAFSSAQKIRNIILVEPAPQFTGLIEGTAKDEFNSEVKIASA